MFTYGYFLAVVVFRVVSKRSSEQTNGSSKSQQEDQQLNVRHFWQIRYAFLMYARYRLFYTFDAVNVVNGSFVFCAVC